ncbi:K(+)/H(+) antiporter [Rhodotorula toruloides]|uniref:Sodium/hydrogen exchanger family-domain containing protein n=1 Tax=Rhodotorula toruloides TaxID=5286 RepID=A0A2S9ZWG8_RHOTO|nr:Sodium/hydrogen exchanger family-domain containing protein [Rhodotorula toruloides]
MAASTGTAAALVTFTATATAGQVWSSSVSQPTGGGGHETTILSGGHDINPIRFDTSNPLVLVIVQLVLILALSRILALAFRWARQPRVVSEILAGILLGPTAFGQIPGFTENIFPAPSIPFLSLIANLGLVLFLFVIGTDVDFSLLRRNLKPTVAVSAAGLVIPFGLGCAVSVGLYNEFISKEVKFTTFMTFIGTSSSITAFPVLSRILSELQLFTDPVGLVVLASGVVNDVIGWCLLALSVALASAGQGVVVVYILLTMVGWTLALFFLARPALNWLARTTGSYTRSDGPTQGYVCATLALVLISAWFCQIIGISEIFGGFLVGLIVPRTLGHHFASRIEDLVVCIFIPLYFATSGLRTNLTLLNTGTIWGWVICVMVVAFSGKFLGSAIAARGTGFTWRQAGATGSLMSAKGLIELIVLNQGLQVGIISTTVFSIFVLEALVLTIASTPLTLAFYPPRHRPSTKHTPPISSTLDSKPRSSLDKSSLSLRMRTRFIVMLDQLESLGAAMVFTHLLASVPVTDGEAAKVGGSSQGGATLTSGDGLLAPTHEGTTSTTSTSPASTPLPPASQQQQLEVTPLRLVELTERGSGVMLASEEAASHLARDPLVSLYRTFASLPSSSGVHVATGEFAMTAAENWPETVARCTEEGAAELLVVPWKLGSASGPREEGNVVESFIPNPFEALFGNAVPGSLTSAQVSGAPLFAAFLRDVFLETSCDVGVLLDCSCPSAPSIAHAPKHLYVPFFGGADDRTCLEIAVQLVKRSAGAVTATVLVVTRAAEPTEEDQAANGLDRSDTDGAEATSTTKLDAIFSPALSIPPSSPAAHSHHLSLGHGGTHHGGTRAGETHYGSSHGQHALASATADDVALEQVSSVAAILPAGALVIERVSTAFPLATAVTRLRSLTATQPTLTLLGRSRLDAPSHRLESLTLLKSAERAGTLGACASSEVRRAMGEAATAVLVAPAEVGAEWVMVVQSRATAGKRAQKRMVAAGRSLSVGTVYGEKGEA